MYNKLISIILIGCCLSLTAFDARYSNISFDELFVLDREKALKELVPGTEDYYHYHCLHAQSQNDLNKFDDLLSEWHKKYGKTYRYKQMLNRKMLFAYEKDPRKSLDHIIDELKLKFDYQKIEEERKIQYPNELDDDIISWEKLGNTSIDKITSRGLELFSKKQLNWETRRKLLKRITRTGFPNLPQLIVDDLNAKHAGQFGYLPIHSNLTKDEMDEVLKLKPNLINFSQFVHKYILRLRPADHINWEQDKNHKSEYLNTLWQYVSKLKPSFNSLKAHVLLQKLKHERSMGKFDEDLFLEYLKLPRNVHYIRSDYFHKQEFRHVRANLNANFSSVTGFKNVSYFEHQLTLDFFEHFLKDADDFKKFEPYVDSNFLDRTFAEIKILHGKGDAEKWYARFKNSSYIKQLKDRIELRLLPQNTEYVGNEDKITLKAAVKNIPKLIVKKYKINLFNYYKRYNKQVSTDIDLDGLVAADTKTVNYSQGPQLRHVESFEVDLKENGVYIVELIGNGISSRALIRKGQLKFTESEGAAGHVFTIYDSNNNQIKDAEIHLSGHIYKPLENGVIRVPYTNARSSQPFIIKKGNFSSLGEFNHNQEKYELSAGFYVNREALVKNGSAVLAVRPHLKLNGNRIPNKLLENVKLTITSRDSKGVSTTTTVNDFKLLEARESFHQINIPEGIRSLTWTLTGDIKKMVDGESVTLSASSTTKINNSYSSALVANAHLRESKDGYYIELLGRTGEPVKQRVIHLTLKHKLVKYTVRATLKTNDLGQVKLGKLEGIQSLTASTSYSNRSWQIYGDSNFSPSEINAQAESTLSIPYIWNESPVADQATLTEMRNGVPVSNQTARIIKEKDYLKIENLPAGNYLLYLKNNQRTISLTTLKGKKNNAYVLADDRYIRSTNFSAPVISEIAKDGDGLKISLKNATPRTRVHIFQTRFAPLSIPGITLGSDSKLKADVYDFSRLQSQYLSERNIGDEYRYILTRRSGKVYPGNMLDRPGLLLNPWVLRTTTTGIADSKSGQAYEGRNAVGRSSAISRFGGKSISKGRYNQDIALDFLQTGSRSFLNLTPDENGIIKLAGIGPGQTVHAVLVDGFNLQYKKSFLEDEKTPYRDLRLKVILDPEKHFVEKKKISVLSKNKDFMLNSISSAKVESYDSLRKVYHLMKTLNPDKNLLEFEFILDWPNLKEEKKLELYSKYACHELNFFIFKKDQAFFNKVIVPYMTNKKGNTFLDHWLKNTDTLKEFTQEWKYSRLNIVEQILLAHKNKNALIKREVQDRFDILKRDRNRLNFLFNSAVQSDNLSLAGGKKQKADFKDLLKSEAKKVMMDKSKEMVNKKGRRGRAQSLIAPATSPPAKKAEALAELDAFAAEEALAPAEIEEVMDDPFGDDLVGGIGDANADGIDAGALINNLRKNTKQYYRQIGDAKEWVENNYYKLPIERHVAELVKVNAFWKDFAAHTDGPFVSGNVAEATGNFTEMMFALSVLDLPFESGKIDSKLEDGKLVLKPENDLILFHRELEATAAVENNVILINQKYFDLQNRFKMEGNEKIEKYITEEFESGKVYGARIIINNPSARNRKIEVLTQLPQGAIPVSNSQETMTSLLNLSAYSTQTIEYFFYFPFEGKFDQFPVHISQEGELLGYEKPFIFNVVDEPTKVDKTTWTWISQNGTQDDVIQHLQNNNMHRTDLGLIAWRMKDAAFAKRVLKLLSTRNHFHYTSYSFALKHNLRNQAAEFVKFSPFAGRCGLYVSTPLLTVDPVERFHYQHREYSPLVNARTYQLGAKRKIVNREFLQQYNSFMKYLSYKQKLSAEDQLTQVYYLLLQDRVEEGINIFNKINRDAVVEKVQYDYMNAYVQFYLEQPQKAEVIAAAYKNYPVIKWRKKFLKVLNHAAEAVGKANIEKATDNRDGMQDHLASKEPVIFFDIEKGQITGEARNLKQVKVSYYLMDIELLFSRKPFIRQLSSDFAIIEPNMVEMKPVNNNKLVFNIPKELRNSNVMVEISGEGVSDSKAYYAHTMNVAVMENYGMLQVVDPDSKPVSKVYVKVYAKSHNGTVKFHKDGYTDLRGKFDYSSVNTGNIDNIESFSFLVLSDKHGAMIKEATPPKQ